MREQDRFKKIYEFQELIVQKVTAIEDTLDQRAELFTKAEEIIATLQKVCAEILKQNGVE